MFRTAALLVSLYVLIFAPLALAQRTTMPPNPERPQSMEPPPPSGTGNTFPQQLPYNAGVVGRGSSQMPYYAMSTSPNTSPMPSAPAVMSPGVGGVGMPFFGGFGGFTPTSMGYGYALQGMADLTRAQGQYWNEIQQARMSREKVSQETFNTQRQRLQFEMDYEKLRPTAAKMRDSTRIAELDWARNDPPDTEIWSGRTFNVLLRSILTVTNPMSGPSIPLDQAIVRGLNLRDRSARGNLSFTKDNGKIDWPDALLEKQFDSIRDDFTKKFSEASRAVNYGEVPDRKLVRELRADLKQMDDKVVRMVGDLSPTEFIDARRQIRTLTDTLQGMSNPLTCKACGQEWRKNVRTVADLVNFCMKNGLEFGPATRPSDFSAYSAAYYPLRNYERGIVGNRASPN